MKRFLSFAVMLTLSCSVALAQRSRPQNTTVPAGTAVEIRIDNYLNSEKTQVGETFSGTLPNSVTVNGRTVFQRGAIVDGHVSKAKPSGRMSDPGELELVVDRIAGRDVNMEPFFIKGESHAKSNVTKIGGGAALGAIIGGLAGGGKGAAIGAGVGTAAGTGAAAATGKKEAIVESEAILPFTFSDAVENTAVSDNQGGWNGAPEFSARDRRVIRSCLGDSSSSLPPGLAKKEKLPPGLEKQVQKNGSLPPGLQKRLQAMPLACEQQLPRLPSNMERVILNRQILMLDSQNRILDLFNLDAD